MTDRHVRRYEAGDRDDVWRVHDRSLRASPMDYDPEYNRYLRHVSREFLDAGGEFLVGTVPGETNACTECTVDRRLVAIGGFQPLTTLGEDYADVGYDRLDPAFGDTVRVRSVAVHPDHRGAGIGTALTRELERRAGASGFRQALLETPLTLSAARAFWEARGYEHVDTVGEYAVYRTRL